MGNTPPVTSINVWVLIGRAAEQQTARGSLSLDALTAVAVGCLYVSVEEKEENEENSAGANFRVETKEDGGRKEMKGLPSQRVPHD